jgi:hypothetical protein
MSPYSSSSSCRPSSILQGLLERAVYSFLIEGSTQPHPSYHAENSFASPRVVKQQQYRILEDEDDDNDDNSQVESLHNDGGILGVLNNNQAIVMEEEKEEHTQSVTVNRSLEKTFNASSPESLVAVLVCDDDNDPHRSQVSSLPRLSTCRKRFLTTTKKTRTKMMLRP